METFFFDKGMINIYMAAALAVKWKKID